MQDLGTLGGSYSGATDINASGQIVGISSNSKNIYPGFLYENGIMYDLNDLVPSDTDLRLAGALAINDAGQIVGMGVPKNGDGFGHAYLLKPVRSPSIAINGRKEIHTGATSISIQGTARGDVLRVRYQINKGAIRSAHGMAHWHLTAELKLGKNNVVVTAVGYGGPFRQRKDHRHPPGLMESQALPPVIARECRAAGSAAIRIESQVRDR